MRRGFGAVLRASGVFACLAAGAVFQLAAAGELAFAKSELWIESAERRHRFVVELAETPAQQARGLMFRADLAAGAGMLFAYGAERHISMWMKNTLVPLDMIFLSAAGEILRIERWTTPLSERPIHSGAPAAAVLEVPGGTADRLGLRPGDRVVHGIFAPRSGGD